MVRPARCSRSEMASMLGDGGGDGASGGTPQTEGNLGAGLAADRCGSRGCGRSDKLPFTDAPRSPPLSVPVIAGGIGPPGAALDRTEYGSRPKSGNAGSPTGKNGPRGGTSPWPVTLGAPKPPGA